MPAAPVTSVLGGCELRYFDANGRISIPTKFRERYGNTVYLLKTFNVPGEECLVIYNEEDYLEVYDALADTYEGDELVQMERLLAANIRTVYIDKSGRMLFPDDFREATSLKDEKAALLVCHPTRIEFWNESKWNEVTGKEIKPEVVKRMVLSPKRKK